MEPLLLEAWAPCPIPTDAQPSWGREEEEGGEEEEGEEEEEVEEEEEEGEGSQGW